MNMNMITGCYRPEVIVNDVIYVIIASFYSFNGEKLYIGESRKIGAEQLKYALFSSVITKQNLKKYVLKQTL